MRRRVVVTGVGCVTPMGHSVEETWSRLLRGESGVGYTTIFDASNFPTRSPPRSAIWTSPTSAKIRIAGSIAAGIRSSPSAPPNRRSTTRASIDRHARSDPLRRLSGQRRRAAGLRPLHADDDCRASKASNSIWPVSAASAWTFCIPRRNWSKSRTCRPGTWPACSMPKARTSNCLTACAASSQAIGEAIEIIRRGDADVMLSGGTHSMIHPFGVTGFNLLTALSTRNDEPTKASRPFDRDRDGFVLGEGAGMVVLEELEHAKARGAKIHGELRRLRLDGRRLPHHRHASRRPRRDQLHAHGPGRRRAESRRHRLHQRPRHEHRRERQGRDAGHQDRSSASRPTRSPSPAPRA